MWCGIKRGWDDRREKPIALSKAKQYGLLLSEFVDYDAGIRTNRSASGTTDAGFGVYVLAECIAVVIDGGGAECKRLRGASHYAKIAAFARFCVNDNGASDFRHIVVSLRI